MYLFSVEWVLAFLFREHVSVMTNLAVGWQSNQRFGRRGWPANFDYTWR
jgi:hypothetical protein